MRSLLQRTQGAVILGTFERYTLGGFVERGLTKFLIDIFRQLLKQR